MVNWKVRRSMIKLRCVDAANRNIYPPVYVAKFVQLGELRQRGMNEITQVSNRQQEHLNILNHPEFEQSSRFIAIIKYI